jgi:hypothetical protein
MRALIGSGGTLVALWLAGCSSSATSQGAGSGIGGSAAGSSGAVSSTGTPSSTGASGSASAGSSPPPSSADRFPASSIIYEDVSVATPDPSSAQVINHLQAAGGWGGSGIFQIDFSITILHADSTVVPRPFTQPAGYYSPDCDVTTVPIPVGGNAEGSTDYACDASQNDCHVLVYQGTRLYELYNTNITGGQATGNPFTTLCEVVWDLTHDYWQSVPAGMQYSRGDQCTSADAAGMPIAPLLVTGAELQAGVVPHALRFILPNADIRKGVYVHPGTHVGGPTGDDLMPPYAAHFRLKSTFDASGLTPAARAVAVALQKYGMFLDDGGNIPLTFDASAASQIGSHDLASIKVTDFDFIASPDPIVTATDNCTRTPLTR